LKGKASLRASALLALSILLIFGSPGCSHSSPPPRKLIVLGVDGLEWRLVLKFAQTGKLPNLSALLADGVSGKLETLEPTHSPAIWTTIATGKRPEKHGILDFAFQDESGEPHLFTSVHRNSKALWNLLDDAHRGCDVLGWWCTFPVEKIDGVMVSQTCLRTQIDVSDGHKIWKGSYLRGIPGQVQPPEFEPRVRAAADRIYGDSKASMRALAQPREPLTPLASGLWDGLSSSFVADQLYADLARDRLKSGQASEVVLLYLGTTDVASHRFWRYFEPELYDHPPRPEELADFGHVIEASYVFADKVLGELRALAPDADFVVVSDHGFHAVNPHGGFSDDAPAAEQPFTSGDHQDAPPGFFLASGPGFRAGSCASDAEHVPVVGRVEDVVPTLLWRLGIPFGEDMDGRPMRDVLSEATLAAAPQRAVKSHEDAAWQKQRAQAEAHAAEDEKHFEQAALRALDGAERQRLSNLGYTGEGLPPPKGTREGGEKDRK
jgi:predicted AlkP superfamily pyrophosphatase or phosphodiesterase